MFCKYIWETGCVDYSGFPLQMWCIGLGTAYNYPHGTYHMEVCGAEEELVCGVCSHLQCLLRVAFQPHACSSESSPGLSLLTWWKSSTCQAEQSTHGDGCLNGYSGAGYAQPLSPNMCLIPFPSQALHSYKEKEQVWAQIWPNEQHRCIHDSGEFSTQSSFCIIFLTA